VVRACRGAVLAPREDRRVSAELGGFVTELRATSAGRGMETMNDPELDEGALECELEALAVDPVSINQKALAFVKEWGVVVTVLIAIMYTFPFELTDRIINWREHDLKIARQALTEIATLQAEKVMNTIKLSELPDPSVSDFVSNTYNMRIYNALYSNKEIFLGVSDRLLYSELYAIAGGFVLSGQIRDGLPFYRLAIKKSEHDDFALIGALREQARALFISSTLPDTEANHNDYIKQAREGYLRGLGLMDDRDHVAFSESYVLYLSELASGELTFGDWKCGADLMSVALRSLGYLVNFDKEPKMSGLYANMMQSYGSATMKPNQSNKGCVSPVPTTRIPSLIREASLAAGFPNPAPPPAIKSDLKAPALSVPTTPP
jgi:hypothetical protein